MKNIHRSKLHQYHTLEKNFLTAAIFGRFVGLFFKQRVKKFAVHFGLY